MLLDVTSFHRNDTIAFQPLKRIGLLGQVDGQCTGRQTDKTNQHCVHLCIILSIIILHMHAHSIQICCTQVDWLITCAVDSKSIVRSILSTHIAVEFCLGRLVWFMVDEYYCSETTTTQVCLGYVNLGCYRAACHTWFWWGLTNPKQLCPHHFFHVCVVCIECPFSSLSLSQCVLMCTPGVLLTPSNVMRIVMGVLSWWGDGFDDELAGSLFIPMLKQREIRRKFPVRKQKEEAISYWINTDPQASWRRLITQLDWIRQTQLADSIRPNAEPLTGSNEFWAFYTLERLLV